MAGGLMPVVSRLLAAGCPSAIKTVRAGLMVANSPYCTTLTDFADPSKLKSLFPRPGADSFGQSLSPQLPPAAKPAQKRLTKEELALQAQAEAALEQAFSILQADDWRRVDTQDGDELCVRTAGGRNVWKYKTVVSCSPEKFAQEVIHNCTNCPSWNKTIKKCQIHEVSDGVEILRQETKELLGGLVSQREFVNVRRRGRRGQMHYSAMASIDHSAFPESDRYVRAQLFPTVFTVRPCADSPDRCIVEGTFNYDLKLRLVPLRVIEGATFSAWRQLRTQLLRCAEHVRA
ncbi:stAR-related lipid transfer protein 3-like [Amphibalanus amphitrite]|uniref:stAR-related lipid transfer protein 3-like n=1 Tax=Amphibalanus amphitrite TaxID=1232801 RepID=UPI001C9003B1|nr:stAR-related lipid transfer protein 3-like [Amphibalanus amphitrite]XP_043214115.1 stAR-related lipid transfer protein 3-like [Amphibalanus amphitrite]XP_043214116.1 stAR-related lipid transfer protein 3-like [Amphibalanus amphitrite]